MWGEDGVVEEGHGKDLCSRRIVLYVKVCIMELDRIK